MNRPQAKLRIGTRGSRLALAQAHNLKATLETMHPGLEAEIVPITTSGDKGMRDTLGAFVREIQVALMDDRADVALHCLKDLPTRPVEGLDVAAYLDREDPRDALIGREPTVAGLPHGACIGTGSVRRSSQIAATRKDLAFSPLVGNIDTRLRQLVEGQYDAIILAIAGLKRLGILEEWQGLHPDFRATPLEFDVMLPAPGQAVLALEIRESDDFTRGFIAPLDSKSTRICSIAERAFLAAFGGGCSVPVAAFATFDHGALHLSGLVAAPDGSKVLRGTATGVEPVAVASTLFLELKEQGAVELFEPTTSLTGGTPH